MPESEAVKLYRQLEKQRIMSNMQKDLDYVDLVKKITMTYPKLNQNWKVRDLTDSSNPQHNPKFYSEFYPPGELFNPYPGSPTIDIYKHSPNREQALIGEMLHYLPSADKQFQELRNRFKQSITPEQKEIDTRVYEKSSQGVRGTGKFEDWVDRSRLDAYIRAGIFPENNPEWEKVLTPKQKDIISEMKKYLGIESVK